MVLDDSFFPEGAKILEPREHFDSCIIGVVDDGIAYSHSKIIKMLMQDGLSEEEAIEHCSYNIEGSEFSVGGWVIIHDDIPELAPTFSDAINYADLVETTPDELPNAIFFDRIKATVAAEDIAAGTDLNSFAHYELEQRAIRTKTYSLFREINLDSVPTEDRDNLINSWVAAKEVFYVNDRFGVLDYSDGDLVLKFSTPKGVHYCYL